MKVKFLSPEWFAKLAELKSAAGDLDIPAAMQGLVINITVTGSEFGDVDLAMASGNIEQGHQADAGTKMIIPVDLAQRLFIENDQSAGMQGFMSGQIRIEGDMSKIMTMQTIPPSEGQKVLQKQILEVTG